MTRGTFANIRIRNLLVPGTEGGVTRLLPGSEIMPVFDAAERYKATSTPLVILAGEEYGTGSSRDWAAKGTMLLGVRAVLASSFERIHRSNLVGMGVLPLELSEPWQSMGFTGEETFDIPIDDSLKPRSNVIVRVTRADGLREDFSARVRIDTPVELDQFLSGVFFHTSFESCSVRRDTVVLSADSCGVRAHPYFLIDRHGNKKISPRGKPFFSRVHIYPFFK